MKVSLRMLSFLIALLFALIFSGCSTNLSVSDASLNIRNDKMLHVKQVLEHYDAYGSPVPQYLELWLTAKQSMCMELNENGEEITSALDSGSGHISFNSLDKKASKINFSSVFKLNYKTLRKNYSNETKIEKQKYVGRECTAYLLKNANSDDWLKLYIDKETGFVLFCDAPLFKLKTALLEILPLAKDRLTEPKGLNFKDGRN